MTPQEATLRRLLAMMDALRVPACIRMDGLGRWYLIGPNAEIYILGISEFEASARLEEFAQAWQVQKGLAWASRN